MDLPDAALEDLQVKKVEELVAEEGSPLGSGQFKGQGRQTEEAPRSGGTTKEPSGSRNGGAATGPMKGTGKRPLPQGCQQEEGSEGHQRAGKGAKEGPSPQANSSKGIVYLNDVKGVNALALAAPDTTKGGGKGPHVKGGHQKGSQETQDAALALVSRWDKGGTPSVITLVNKRYSQKMAAPKPASASVGAVSLARPGRAS